MRRKLALVGLILAATVTAAQAKPAHHPRIIQMNKDVCFQCSSCDASGHCTGCRVIKCPIEV